MKLAFTYWALITVLGIIHLHAMFLNLPWNIPIYATCFLVIGAIYYLYKKNELRISQLPSYWNGMLLFLQFLLILIYLAVEPSWVYLVPFILFIGLETIRFIEENKVVSFQEASKQFDEQRTHFNETFRVVRSERHDFLKHVSALHFMLENDKSEEAKIYLDELVDSYEQTNLSIKGEQGIVAGILHQMYRRAKSAGISVVYDLDLPLSTLPIADHRLVTLIGNLLANGIEACEDWQDQHNEQAKLTLQFYKRSGLYLLICKNSSLPIPTAILDKLFQTYGKTTKTDDHEGLGTKIIHDIVNDHQGYLDFVYKEEEFMVKIKIPAIR